MSGLRRWSVAASIAASVMCVLPPVAGAVQLKCGDTVTEDVVLEADLKDCPRHGLTVGANGVTIDLNGHTIAGDGAEDIFADVIDTGVLDSGFDQVTIKNGTIRQFGVAVGVGDAIAVRIIGLDVSVTEHPGASRVEPITVSNSSRTGIWSNRIFGGFQGIFMTRSDHSIVAHNVVSASGIGISISEGTSDLIVRNRVSRTVSGIFALGGTLQRFVANSISDTPMEAGIGLAAVDHSLVLRNRVARAGLGIDLGDDTDIRVLENTITDAGDGIVIIEAPGSVVAHNAVTRTVRTGMLVESSGAPPAGGGVVFRANVVRDAGTDGVVIGTRFFGRILGTVLERNIVIDAGDDGFDVREPATTLTRNLALRNRDLGIDAVAGVMDGGGNHAFGNGNPLQCLNVACPRRQNAA